MHELPNLIPDAEAVLALSPEELGLRLLMLLKRRHGEGRMNQGMLNINDTPEEVNGSAGREPPYGNRTQAVKLAIVEALAWLSVEILIVPTSGTNGRNGWCVLSRKAHALRSEDDVKLYRSAKVLPRALLHEWIAKDVWTSFARGEYETAVFQAMRAVEVAVRDAAPELKGLLGVRLMRQAFRPKSEATGEIGPLTDELLEAGEQEGMMHLFSGAVAALKNPHSHRVVRLHSAEEAAAIIIMASQLLRIVENRQIWNEIRG